MGRLTSLFRHPLCICNACTRCIAMFRRNPVWIIFLGAFFHSLMTSISFGAILDLYLKNIAPDPAKKNRFVGTVETVRGLTGLVVSLPIGILADKYTKMHILRLSTIVGFIGICICCYSVWTDSTTIIFAGVCVFAIYNQAAMGLYGPILSEMVPADDLQKTLSKSMSIYAAGQFFGPLIQICVISLDGSHKDGQKLRLSHLLLTVGMTLFTFAAALFWTPLPDIVLEQQRGLLDTTDGSAAPEGSNETSRQVPVWHEEMCCGLKKKWLIPIFIESENLFVAIGSGMTFKFWPLFFEKDFHLDYLSICVITFLTWVSIASCNLFVPHLATYFKNTATTYLFLFFTGVSLLFIIGLVHMPLIPTVTLVILRNGIMNAGGPLIDSVVLNAVPAKHRAKWGSIQSLTRATWSGSAFIGGIFSDKYDYRVAFTVTAIVHTCAGIFNIFAVFPTIKRQERTIQLHGDEDDDVPDAEVHELSLASGVIPD